MKKTFKVSDMLAVAWWNPGDNLDELSLKKLHNELIAVNENSHANINHKMLRKGTAIDELKKYFAKVLVTAFYMEERPVAFLISPILSREDRPVIHTGLMVIEKNPGGNLMSFLLLIHVTLGYELFGPCYMTNISSTPSAIESFAEAVTEVWPGPDVNLKKIPEGYSKILQKLKTEYLDEYFPDSDQIQLDQKRFVMRSNSSGMGFKTDFFKVSRASQFKYNLFCHTWIDYKNEEDVIQIGEVGFMKYVANKLALQKLKMELSYASRNKKEKNLQTHDHDLLSEKKRAS